MHRRTNPNIEILEAAVKRLGELTDRLVFLGGCATGLLITDSAAPPIRFTHDVDVITEAATLAEYYRLSEQLRAQGFVENNDENSPICRWRAEGLLLDVMPTNPSLLGFGSDWYQEALEKAEEVDLPSGKRIRMITAPYFLACKLAAFADRGEGDFQLSHDMEDIVAVIDGRSELADEVLHAAIPLKEHLAKSFADLLNNGRFQEALPGHLPGDAASQTRLPILLKRIQQVADLRQS